MKKAVLTIGLFAGALAASPAASADYDQLDLSGANDTYIASPTGDFLSYPGYMSTVESLYLDPLGDTGPFAGLDLPTDTYDYTTAVPQGTQQVVDTVLSDYDAGKLSAATPDVLFGYSDSSTMISAAEPILYADGVPTQDLDIVLVGDTSNPLTGIIATLLDTPSIEPLATMLGLGPLEGLTTPDSFYNTDVYTINGDGFADYSAMNLMGDIIHMGYIGLTQAQIDAATVTTEGLTNYFTIATPDIGTMISEAVTNLLGGGL
jgi:PE-PPE domain